MKKLFEVVVFLVMALVPGFAASPALIKQAPASTSQLERDIQHELLLLPDYTIFDKLGFEVNGITVRLTGEVTHRSLKDAAECAVKELPGVRRVVNNIVVLSPSPLDNQIRIAAFHAIYGEPAFSDYASRSIQPIHILVNNGCLTLEGTVANETDRKTAYTKALVVPGVLVVSNHLRVTR